MACNELTDREILLAGDAAAFALFYDRHAEWVLGFLRRRSGNAEQAADLTAEVFAAALSGRRRYRSDSPAAHAWLLAIANNKLNSAMRSGYLRESLNLRVSTGSTSAPISKRPSASSSASSRGRAASRSWCPHFGQTLRFFSRSVL